MMTTLTEIKIGSQSLTDTRHSLLRPDRRREPSAAGTELHGDKGFFGRCA
jgi:hypothetical protein